MLFVGTSSPAEAPNACAPIRRPLSRLKISLTRPSGSPITFAAGQTLAYVCRCTKTLCPFATAWFSLIPAPATVGERPTIYGARLSSKASERPSKALRAATRAPCEASGESWSPPRRTSPAAQICGTFVRNVASVEIPCRSYRTPATSRPMSSTVGTCPAASITASAWIRTSSEPCFARTPNPDSAGSIASTAMPVRMSIPRVLACSITVVRISSSRLVRIFSSISSTTTRTPTLAKRYAHSIAITPPPMIATVFGRMRSVSTSLCVSACSNPAIAGFAVCAPVTTRI
jgi:hypothetical protein